jgi:hypothetical protein
MVPCIIAWADCLQADRDNGVSMRMARIRQKKLRAVGGTHWKCSYNTGKVTIAHRKLQGGVLDQTLAVKGQREGQYFKIAGKRVGSQDTCKRMAENVTKKSVTNKTKTRCIVITFQNYFNPHLKRHREAECRD